MTYIRPYMPGHRTTQVLVPGSRGFKRPPPASIALREATAVSAALDRRDVK